FRYLLRGFWHRPTPTAFDNPAAQGAIRAASHARPGRCCLVSVVRAIATPLQRRRWSRTSWRESDTARAGTVTTRNASVANRRESCADAEGDPGRRGGDTWERP